MSFKVDSLLEGELVLQEPLEEAKLIWRKG